MDWKGAKALREVLRNERKFLLNLSEFINKSQQLRLAASPGPS